MQKSLKPKSVIKIRCLCWELNRPVWQIPGPVERVLEGRGAAEQPSGRRCCGSVLGTERRQECKSPQGCWGICLLDKAIWKWEYMCILYTEAVPNPNACIYWSDLPSKHAFFLCKQTCCPKDLHQVFSVTVSRGSMCWLLGLLAGRDPESCVCLKEDLRR